MRNFIGVIPLSTQGNGLGLALVNCVTNIIGSDIKVNSEPGKGRTFTVKLRREANGDI